MGAKKKKKVNGREGFQSPAVYPNGYEVSPKIVSLNRGSEQMGSYFPVQLHDQSPVVARELYVVLRTKQHLLLTWAQRFSQFITFREQEIPGRTKILLSDDYFGIDQTPERKIIVGKKR